MALIQGTTSLSTRPWYAHTQNMLSCVVTAKEQDLVKIDRIQIIALLKTTGCLNSNLTAALEVITNVVPICLRFQEVVVTEYIRILRKNPIRSIALYDQNSITATSNPQLMLPSQLKFCAIKPTAQRINLDNMDRNHKNDPDILCCRSFTRTCITNEILGNANARSKEQRNGAKLIPNDYVNNVDMNSLICYIDGPALGNPVPCGDGVAIHTDSALNTPILMRKPVSKKSISYHGELVAIDLALESAQPYQSFHQHINKIYHFLRL